MTFTEAALAVLEREGRPLHAREIAEKAVELGILSHVGKTPVQTMSGRLSAAVQRTDGSSPFVRVKPGVFALAEWSGKAPGPKTAPIPAPTPAPTPPASPESKPAARSASAAPALAAKLPSVESLLATSEPEEDDDIVVFVEEEDDDAPPAAASESSVEGEPTRTKRKRRRKRKRTDEVLPVVVIGGSEDTPSVTALEPERNEPVRHAPDPSPAPREGGRGNKPALKPQSAAIEPEPSEPSRSVEASDELLDRVITVLRKANRPLPTSQIAEQIGRLGPKGTWLVEAMLEADNLWRQHQGQRLKFVERRSGWMLVDKEVSAEILTAERQITEARDRLMRLAERQLLRRLRSLAPVTFGKAMILYLQASGFEGIRPIDRGSKDELHLTVSDRRAGRRFRTAVVLRRSNADDVLSDRAIVELRGSLHHYDAASILVITTGGVSDTAKSEAIVPNLPPVSLVDGDSLVRDMVRLGLGVEQRRLAIPAFDEGFFGGMAD